MSILKSLDVLIGLAVVMLLLATVVTSFTQLYLRSTFTRSRNLRRGIIELLHLIDARRLGPNAEYIAACVLTHPSIARPNTSLGSFMRNLVNRFVYDWRGLPAWPNRNQADVIEREELMLILLEWAAGEGPMAKIDSTVHRPGWPQKFRARLQTIRAWFRSNILGQGKPQADLDQRSLATVENWRTKQVHKVSGVQKALREALVAGGYEDPSTALRSIRTRIVSNERTMPTEPASKWRSLAFTEGSIPDATAKVFANFDSIVTRAGMHYGFHAKVASSLTGLAVCLGMQLDAIQLVRRLDSDDEFRKAVVARHSAAIKVHEEASAAKAKLSKSQPARAEELKIATEEAEKARQDLAKASDEAQAILNGLKIVPDKLWWSDAECSRDAQALSPSKWTIGVLWPPNWTLKPIDSCRQALWPHLPGILLSWVLVSLGAPFWYDLLKRLAGLRSVLADKEEADRVGREQSQSQPTQTSADTMGSGFGATLSVSPGLARTKSSVRLRKGSPTTAAEPGESLEAGSLFSYAEVVSGQSLPLPTDGTNQHATEPRWYKSLNNEYLWAGDATPLQS